jgi:hypothetical protein
MQTVNVQGQVPDECCDDRAEDAAVNAAQPRCEWPFVFCFMIPPEMRAA